MKRIKILGLSILLIIGSSSIFAQSGWTIFNTSNSPLLDLGIQTIAIDQNNHKWVGTVYGLGVYDDNAWTIYTKANSSLPDDNVTVVKIDKNNVAWIGTNNGGLAKFDGTTWTVWNTKNSIIPCNNIRCIAFDTLGNKWFGTTNGLLKLADTALTLWNYSNTGLHLDRIDCVAVDKNNLKYISSEYAGVFYFNDTTFTDHDITNSFLTTNGIYSIVFDSSGTRWFGTDSKGIMAQHTPDTTNIEWYWPNNTPEESAWTIHQILIDSLQNEYMATQLSGFQEFDGCNWYHWKTNNSPIPSDWITCLNQEKNGVFWIGTNNGLARFDKSMKTGIKNNKMQ
jgi:ligand-binding sensor domain-containing protein